MKTNITKINGIEINLNNFPGDDGTGLNHCRNTRGLSYVTLTFKGFVTYRDDAEADGEHCGELGKEFKSEQELLDFIAAEFE